ncbi:InlB B-repeat-containing protein [Anaerophaga thermohalophila]|uniref:InlB B-repeat-containing protein n=1 Tax=Anaerophaga thermohalophila TaxID=177400 RepID=UPI00037EFD10|nr:T9SS type A sorting domain-containing protein [Anaerophaga thermohalophila]
MKKILPLLSFLVILNFGISDTNGQICETTVMTGDTYTTASYVSYSHGHRANLYKDKNGTFHMAVVDNYELKYLTSSDNGQTWTEQTISSEYDGKVSDAMIKGDGNGNLFVAVETRPGYDYGSSILLDYYFWRHIYVYHNLDGTWQKESVETPAQSMGGKAIRDLLIANDGTVHLITIYSGWGDYGGEAWEFRRDPATGSWQTIKFADYIDTSVDHSFGFFPAIMQDDGSIAGIYWRNKGSGELGYRTCTNGTWSAPVIISSAAYNRQDICKHPDGNPRIVYTTNATPQQIMYKSTLDNSPGTPIFTLAEGQKVNAVKIHANGLGKETVIINVEGQRTIYAEKYPDDTTWPATFQQVPLTEEAYWPSTVSAPNDTLVNFSCTYLDFNPGTDNGPHGPNIRYFFSISDKRTLSLETSPLAGGTVSGEGDYVIFSTQTIEATPETGYQFIQWSENGQFISANAQTDVEMFDNRTLTAEFQPIKDYTISLLINEPVHGNISGAGTYTNGEMVTITATPDEGYHFVNWTEGVTEVSTSAEYTFSATENKVLTASFEINQYNLVTNANNSLYGSTTGDGVYNYATEVFVEALPVAGYGFSHWVSNMDSLSSDNPFSFEIVNDSTLTAIFKEQYTITATIDPVDKGTVEGTGDYLIGETITLTAIPENLFSFSHWSEGGITISNEAEITFTVDGARDLTAHFVPWFAGGDGSSGNPYQISEPYQLDNVRKFLGSSHSDKYFVLTNDIDMSSYLAEEGAGYNDGKGWNPIGPNYDNSFRGKFDGQGFAIENLWINRPTEQYVGLFGYVYGYPSGYIKNLEIINTNIQGDYFVGTLAGAIYYSGISNIVAKGTINAQRYYVGGLTGENLCSISNCFVDVDVSSGSSSSIGAVIGRMRGNIVNTISFGSVAGNTSRGLTGSYSQGSVINSYWDIETSGQTSSAGGGEGKTSAELRCVHTFNNWDFGTIWDIQPDKNNGYPFLRWQTPETTAVTALTDFTIDQGDMSLTVGETYQLTATFTPTDATVQCLNWSTNDETIVTINPTGFIEVVGPGTATLSAYHSGLNVTKSITVTGYYQIDVLSDPETGGTVSGAGQYENNALVTLSATANSGYEFTEWSEGGTIISSDNPLIFNATNNRTITAHFVPVHNIIIQTVNGSVEVTNDAGEVIVPDDETTGSYILHEGLAINLEATPDVGYHFLEWQEGVSTLSADNPYSIIVSEDRTLNAVFEINTYTLNYSAGANGTITGDTPQTVEHGQDGTAVTAVPNTGYHFEQWSDGVTTAARTDLGVTGDINVTAEFAVDKWQVTFSVTQDGQPVESAQILISSVGTDLLTDNTGQAVTTLPDGNYLYDVIINSLLMIDDATLEVSGADATENITINATFVSSAEHSTISIWPNPVNEVVWIEGSILITEITVFDMAGNLVVLISNPEEKVNLSFLPPGFYLLKITDTKGNHTVKRIIKN